MTREKKTGVKNTKGKWVFYPPYFKGTEKPKSMIFNSAKEFNKFLKTLPKNWRAGMEAVDL